MLFKLDNHHTMYNITCFLYIYIYTYCSQFVCIEYSIFISIRASFVSNLSIIYKVVVKFYINY